MTRDEERVGVGCDLPVRCVRADVGWQCGNAEPGHDFCAPCLAWLRGDEDEDPLAKSRSTPKKLSSLGAPYPPDGVDDEAWFDYLAAALEACS